jgi:[acyl-carrier-protein] S-malonyltransferase
VLAFTFPGQGSQRSGMGRAWVDHPSFELVAEASDIAERDLATLVLDAPDGVLKETANAQLSTFLVSLVVLDAVERIGLTPAMCGGHSLGEYTALVASGAVSFADGIRLVVERGTAMQVAASGRTGTMAAIIGMSDEDADAACQLAETDVWVANYNAPGQVVISGTPDGIEAATSRAKALGARKVLPIPVSGAFHTPLMLPARDRLRAALQAVTFHAPEVPVVANVDARVHQGSAEWPRLLSAQLCSPVRWRQTLETLVG